LSNLSMYFWKSSSLRRLFVWRIWQVDGATSVAHAVGNAAIPDACSHSGGEQLQLAFRILQHNFSVNNRFVCHVAQRSGLDDLRQRDACAIC
jgi:hypothetical protein